MHGIELFVALLLVATVLAGIARYINVHYAIVLVLGGVVLGLIPGLSTPRIDPNVVLFIFLPPLIYAAAFGSSTQDLRAHAVSIGLLAVGLVLATMGAVAVVAHAVAGIGWGPAFVLGAILGPTDPIAATAVLRRVGAPGRVSTILEGEALVNDATALTAYKVAVAAVVSGHFSLSSGVLHFVGDSAGGVAVGVVAGWLSVEVRRRIDESQIEISISLLTAYLAYLPADRLGFSGVLAAVAAGMYAGSRTEAMLSPSSRLRALGFWDALTFLLEAVLFLEIGLQLRYIDHGLHVVTPLAYAAAVIATLMALRMAWMFVVPGLVRLADPRERGEPPRTRRAELVVLGWSGMRGGVSLAAALALPTVTAAGGAFPHRSIVVFVAYVTIAVTLLLPGLTLSRLVRLLGLGEEEALAREEARARIQLAHAALRHIEEVADREQLEEAIVDQVRMSYELRIERLESRMDGTARGDDATVAHRVRQLRRELVGVERERLHELRRRGKVSAQSQRRIGHELDLEEARLSR